MRRVALALVLMAAACSSRNGSTKSATPRTSSTVPRLTTELVGALFDVPKDANWVPLHDGVAFARRTTAGHAPDAISVVDGPGQRAHVVATAPAALPSIEVFQSARDVLSWVDIELQTNDGDYDGPWRIEALLDSRRTTVAEGNGFAPAPQLSPPWIAWQESSLDITTTSDARVLNLTTGARDDVDIGAGFAFGADETDLWFTDKNGIAHRPITGGTIARFLEREGVTQADLAEGTVAWIEANDPLHPAAGVLWASRTDHPNPILIIEHRDDDCSADMGLAPSDTTSCSSFTWGDIEPHAHRIVWREPDGRVVSASLQHPKRLTVLADAPH